MFKAFGDSILAASAISVTILVSPVASADLGRAYTPEPVAAPSPWTFTFTTYGWVPWLSGNATIKGRAFDVQVTPIELLDHLNWSTLPAWMSYAEARNGPVGLFNDIVYANVSGSKDFARPLPGPLPPLLGGVSVNYEQATVEFGGTYQVWSGANPALAGSAALDLLAGGRYWHQDASASGFLSLPPFSRETDRSGSVDWVDPFVGARLRQQLAPGESLMLRADVGGFGVGSDATWQVLATYNWQMCALDGHLIDGYLGYRALSVDYSQGSGNTQYKFDVLFQGPVAGATLHF
jgi:hypothetical protein